MNLLKLAPLLSLASLSALGLAGCGGGPAPDAFGRYPAADGPGSRFAGAPLATLPPAAGRVVAVRRVERDGGIEQRIVLEGPASMAGENGIVVRTPAGAGEGGRADPPDAADIEAEMVRLFPGVVLRISPDVERDAQGPFGYALGERGGLTCLYAWQSVGAAGAAGGPSSVRVRLCRRQPAAALLDLVRGLDLAGPAPGMAIAGAGGLGGDGLGGDALDAAIGRSPARRSADDPRPVSSADPDRPAAPEARASARPRFPRRPRAGRTAERPAPRRALPPLARSSIPPVPLPSEVAGPSDRAPARSTAAGLGGDLPLPR